MTRAEPPAAPLMGVFAIDWQQTETDAVQGLAPDWLRIGASWRWSGTPLRLDATAALMRLGPAQASPDIHPRARAIAARLGCTDLDRIDSHLDQTAPAMGLALTDGSKVYHARLVRTARGWVVVFDGFLPPPGQELFVIDSAVTISAAPQPPQQVICFSDDTVITTASGPRPIDQLQPGDLVQTLDNGLQPVLWVGRSRLSGLALQRFPHLRPIRLRRGALGTGEPDEDLRVSPAHRLLVRGARARPVRRGRGAGLRARSGRSSGHCPRSGQSRAELYSSAAGKPSDHLCQWRAERELSPRLRACRQPAPASPRAASGRARSVR